MSKGLFILVLCLSIVLSSCSSSLSDAFKKNLSFVKLKKKSSFVLVSNSTAEGQEACLNENSVVIRSSFPAGRELHCRDLSALSTEVQIGQVCPGGAIIFPLSKNNSTTPFSKLTVCGVRASSIMAVSERSDGGTINELRFSNLPWGCDAHIECSFDPTFSEEATSSISFFVQPPECPFCPRQNQATCLPCRDIADDEEIISGQVIHTSCSGENCLPCEVLHQTGEFIDHGQGKVFYTNESGSCGTKCDNQGLLRICDNGLWKGDPAYQFPQCFDTVCGCSLPGDPIKYDHGTTTTIYKYDSPACGIDCQPNSLAITCDDAKWLLADSQLPVPDTELETHPSRTCAKRVCHCVRPSRETVADGQSKTVFQKNVVGCTERCSDFDATITCNRGTLTASDPSFLDYGFDQCGQEYCGCRVPLAGDGFILLADGGSTTLYQYDQNSVAVPDACTNSDYRIQVSCNDKTLSPTYPSAVFQYQSCQHTPLSCTFIEGSGNEVTVGHNNQHWVSRTSTPGCGETCDNLRIRCNNRAFEKRVASVWTPIDPIELAQYSSATYCRAKDCNCHINGFIIPFGHSDSNFYKVEKVTDCNLNGCEEARATITCEQGGPLSDKGDDPLSYQYKACEVIPCNCAVPWGGTIENGKTIKAFSIERARCEQPDVCQEPNNFKSVTCNNGDMTLYDSSVFQYPTCSPEVCFCTHGNIQTPFGETLTVYESEVAPAGDSCSSISAILTCNNGGTWSGADPAQYPYTTCTDLHDDGTGGGSGGGTGNDEGPGAGIKARVGLSDSTDGSRDCTDHDVNVCRTNIVSVTVDIFEKTSCILPWGRGEIEFYGSVAAFDTACVTPPEKCSNHRIIRTCHFPKWTGSDTYRFPSCEEKPICP